MFKILILLILSAQTTHGEFSCQISSYKSQHCVFSSENKNLNFNQFLSNVTSILQAPAAANVCSQDIFQTQDNNQNIVLTTTLKEQAIMIAGEILFASSISFTQFDNLQIVVNGLNYQYPFSSQPGTPYNNNNCIYKTIYRFNFFNYNFGDYKKIQIVISNSKVVFQSIKILYLVCDQSCMTCNNEGPENCLKCNFGFYRYENNYCQNTCDTQNGYYIYQDTQLFCNKCDQRCLSCNGSGYQNCSKCKSPYYLFKNYCLETCPNGYIKDDQNSLCTECDKNTPCINCSVQNCQMCFSPSTNVCNSCSNTMQLKNNQCVCKDSQGIISTFGGFYQCSLNNVAVLSITLSQDKRLLFINFGTQLYNSFANEYSPQVCQKIQMNYPWLGSVSCIILNSSVQVSIDPSSNIAPGMEVSFINLAYKYSQTVLITSFYKNKIIQQPFTAIAQFNCDSNINPGQQIVIQITDNIGDPSQSGFVDIQLLFVPVQGQLTTDQQALVSNAIQNALITNNQQKIQIDVPMLPTCQLVIRVIYTLKYDSIQKVQDLTFNMQASTFININSIQSNYSPIYRSMYLRFFVTVLVQNSDPQLGTFTINQPVDIQVKSQSIPTIISSIKNFSNQRFEIDIPPYTLSPSISDYSFSIEAILTQNKTITNTKLIQFSTSVSALFVQIIGGQTQYSNYKKPLQINTLSRDYELQDPSSPQYIIFTWQCKNLLTTDGVCKNTNNVPIQITQQLSTISFPPNTFNPYSVLQFTVQAQKDNRISKDISVYMLQELDIPPLIIESNIQNTNFAANLYQDIQFTLNYDSKNTCQDILSYTLSILYDDVVVSTMRFDYYQIKIRLINYLLQINPSNNLLKFRFSVCTQQNQLPSVSTILVSFNLPPTQCILTVSPNTGVALQTLFTLSMTQCQTNNSPLSYQFYYYLSESDMELEISNPSIILRRQILDQTQMQTVTSILPQGKLIVMGVAIDSLLAMQNVTFSITVTAQTTTPQNYMTQIKKQIQLFQDPQQTSEISKQIINLSILGEDLSITAQVLKLEGINDVTFNLIQSLFQIQNQIPSYSNLSTFANKVVIQLLQSTLLQSSDQKNQILTQIQNLLSKNQPNLQNNNQYDLNLMNQMMQQNLYDAFKMLNSTIYDYTATIIQYEAFNNLTFWIGCMINYLNTPNQGQQILQSNIMTLQIDSITSKYLYKYAQTNNPQPNNNTYSVVQSSYYKNFYENSTEFQNYTNKLNNQTLKKTIVNNIKKSTYSSNKLVISKVSNSNNNVSLENQTLLKDSNFIYNFTNATVIPSKNYTCFQKDNKSWSNSQCSLVNRSSNNFMCLCQDQKPTTIIEALKDVVLDNKNIQTILGDQGIKNIVNFDKFYYFAVFYVLSIFTLLQIFLCIFGRRLDKKSRQKINQNESNQNQTQGEQKQINSQNNSIIQLKNIIINKADQKEIGIQQLEKGEQQNLLKQPKLNLQKIVSIKNAIQQQQQQQQQQEDKQKQLQINSNIQKKESIELLQSPYAFEQNLLQSLESNLLQTVQQCQSEENNLITLDNKQDAHQEALINQNQYENLIKNQQEVLDCSATSKNELAQNQKQDFQSATKVLNQEQIDDNKQQELQDALINQEQKENQIKEKSNESLDVERIEHAQNENQQFQNNIQILDLEQIEESKQIKQETIWFKDEKQEMQNEKDQVIQIETKNDQGLLKELEKQVELIKIPSDEFLKEESDEENGNNDKNKSTEKRNENSDLQKRNILSDCDDPIKFPTQSFIEDQIEKRNQEAQNLEFNNQDDQNKNILNLSIEVKLNNGILKNEEKQHISKSQKGTQLHIQNHQTQEQKQEQLNVQDIQIKLDNQDKSTLDDQNKCNQQNQPKTFIQLNQIQDDQQEQNLQINKFDETPISTNRANIDFNLLKCFSEYEAQSKIDLQSRNNEQLIINNSPKIELQNVQQASSFILSKNGQDQSKNTEKKVPRKKKKVSTFAKLKAFKQQLTLSKNLTDSLQIYDSNKNNGSTNKISNFSNALKDEEKIIVTKTDAVELKETQFFEKNAFLLQVLYFHPFMSIFFIYCDEISRSTRFQLFYLQILHSLSISIVFAGYQEFYQQLVISIISAVLIFVIKLLIEKTHICSKKGKCVSVFLQLAITITYYYIILAITSGKEPSESNQFIFLFFFMLIVDFVVFQILSALLFTYIARKYVLQDTSSIFIAFLFNMLSLQLIIQGVNY
ncbi:hypothetical protein ABPG74_000472 [Tetrahymena malaccensis]